MEKKKEKNIINMTYLKEGEYLNGIKWNGKIYNKEGKIDFEIKEGNGIGKVKEIKNYIYNY